MSNVQAGASGGRSSTIISIVAAIIGALLAAITLVGLISSQIDSTARNPGNVGDPQIPYGTTSG